MLTGIFPFLSWSREMDRFTLRADAMAGLTGALVVLPQGVAFATLAGMPPQYGLYAAMVPAVVAALFGSSRHLVSGPTTAASIVLFTALASLATPGSPDYIRLALTLTLMVGIFELVLGLARFGFLVNFISHSVIVGFTAGAAIHIGASQLRHFFGIDIPTGLPVHETLIEVARSMEQVSSPVVLVGVVTIMAGVAAKHAFPRSPYLVTAMLAGGVTAVVLDAVLGPKLTGIETVGALPATLPPLSTPDFAFGTIKELAPTALAVTLFALTEAVSISRSLAARSGQLIHGNQEFIGQGLSNIAGSFFSSYVATGSFNRSAVNFQAGAVTPLAAIVAGVVLMMVVPAVGPLGAWLPNATMAGILFMVAWGLVDWKEIKRILRANRGDAGVLVITFLATLLLELDFAILLGVLASLIVYLHRASQPSVLVRVPDPHSPRRSFTTDAKLPECPQLAIVRIDGALFFGAVSFVAERLRIVGRRSRMQKHLLIFARSISFVDVAGAELLAQTARERRRAGGALYLTHVKPEVDDTLKKGGYLDVIGHDNLFSSKNDAIREVFERLDHRVCSTCRARIFNECRSIPPPDGWPSEAVARSGETGSARKRRATLRSRG